jgi:hypothetical protein
MRMPDLSFSFDCRSPDIHLAHAQLRQLGVPITCRPFDIRSVTGKTRERQDFVRAEWERAA